MGNCQWFSLSGVLWLIRMVGRAKVRDKVGVVSRRSDYGNLE